MDENLRQAAAQAIGNIFETMFFVFLEPLQPEREEWRTVARGSGSEWLRGVIGFQGRIKGTLRLWIPYGLAGELATDFLGLETEASDTQAVDIVRELTNMICGNLFAIFDRQQVYLLDLPQAELVRFDPEQAGAGNPEDRRLDFLAGDRMIRLEIESGPVG
ncbi:MAG: chemotaxis protein CheX [Deltaproteobacteria bacterium]|nr:chemotaxis protein CheX [Deltaproteobacteria bacterium]